MLINYDRHLPAQAATYSRVSVSPQADRLSFGRSPDLSSASLTSLALVPLWSLPSSADLRSAPEGAAPAEARRAQFAALAAAVDLGIIGAYGSDAQGTTA